jgi:hypothetical protein
MPVSFLKNWSAAKSYATGFGALLRRGGATHFRVVDPALNHAFTGSLVRSGRWGKDVIKGTLEAQMKASRIQGAYDLRQVALKIGKEQPERADDVFVPLDLNLWKKEPHAKELRQRDALFRALDPHGGALNGRHLHDLDMTVIEEELKDAAFYGLTKNTEDEAKVIAQEILDGVRAPIENGVWVDRKTLLDTDFFAPPSFVKAYRSAWARGAEWGADAVNDYMKASILLLNPAYYPMNIVGNGVMLLMQQGALAPLNVMRAAHTHWELGDVAFLIDHYVGGGLTSPAALSGVLRSGKISDPLREISNLLVDRYPRRAAFIYEARKLGFEGPEAVREILTNPEHVDALRIASQRTKNSMVDFDNLSHFEKEVLAKFIFVYPWLKGATYWTARFPKDHPLQATAYAVLYAWQQGALDDAFPGGHPDYLDTWIPLGETERDGKTYPYGIGGRQLTTFTTPYDVVQSLGSAAIGRDGQQLAEMLNPIFGEAVKQATGYDTFTHKEVDRGVLAGLNRIFNPTEGMPGVKAVQQALRSDEERERDNARKLYPRSRDEDWLRVGLGSLAPTPVNPEVAQKLAHQGPLSSAERLDKWVKDGEEALGRPLPEQLKKLKGARMEYDKQRASLKEELGKDELADNELLAAMIDNFALLYPERTKDATRWREQALKMNPEAAKPYIKQFREYLGWDEINKWEKAIDEIKKAREAKK